MCLAWQSLLCLGGSLCSTTLGRHILAQTWSCSRPGRGHSRLVVRIGDPGGGQEQSRAGQDKEREGFVLRQANLERPWCERQRMGGRVGRDGWRELSNRGGMLKARRGVGEERREVNDAQSSRGIPTGVLVACVTFQSQNTLEVKQTC